MVYLIHGFWCPWEGAGTYPSCNGIPRGCSTGSSDPGRHDWRGTTSTRCTHCLPSRSFPRALKHNFPFLGETRSDFFMPVVEGLLLTWHHFSSKSLPVQMLSNFLRLHSQLLCRLLCSSIYILLWITIPLFALDSFCNLSSANACLQVQGTVEPQHCSIPIPCHSRQN